MSRPFVIYMCKNILTYYYASPRHLHFYITKTWKAFGIVYTLVLFNTYTVFQTNKHGSLHFKNLFIVWFLIQCMIKQIYIEHSCSISHFFIYVIVTYIYYKSTSQYILTDHSYHNLPSSGMVWLFLSSLLLHYISQVQPSSVQIWQHSNKPFLPF
jgi:hypothetical protein